MAPKPTYEELEQRIKELEEEPVELKHVEEALWKSETQKQAILSASADMIMQYDKDLRIIWANNNAAAIINKTPEDLIGHKCHKIFQDADVPCNGCPCIKALETGNIGNSIMYQPAMDVVGETYWDNFAVPIKDESGNVVSLIELSRNVTEEVQSEKALRESEKKFRTLFDYAGDAIGIHDLDGHFLEVNQEFCKRLGYSLEEMLQMTPMDIDTSEYSAIVSERIEELQRRGHAIFETAHTRRDGSIIPTELSSRIIEFAGKPAVLSIARDITERKQAEEEKKVLEAKLQQAQKMEAIGTLAGGIAHDFNNLLMGIQGHSSLLMLHASPDHPHFERLKGIQDMVQAGTNLTEQLLGFARGGKYEAKPTDLNELIKQSCEMFGRTQKNIEINRKHQKGIWPVEVDRGQIQQVLLNLYVNAWHAMSGGGYLYIETSNVMLDENNTKPFNMNPGKYVKISVTDTGAGMDKTTQQKIFDPFFTTKEIGRGTGLGLASAYGIIKNHSGIINVYSEKGQGSIFNIYLPASEKEVSITKKSRTDEIPKGTETVLFVDDEEIILDVGKDMLTEIGYKVLIAKSGKEAVEVYKKHKDTIDLVILDMIMPHMDGGEAYDIMKEINPNVKVLLSSGYSIEGQATNILERGCNGFIQKPFNIAELSGAIREFLDKE